MSSTLYIVQYLGIADSDAHQFRSAKCAFQIGRRVFSAFGCASFCDPKFVCGWRVLSEIVRRWFCER